MVSKDDSKKKKKQYLVKLNETGLAIMEEGIAKLNGKACAAGRSQIARATLDKILNLQEVKMDTMRQLFETVKEVMSIDIDINKILESNLSNNSSDELGRKHLILKLKTNIESFKEEYGDRLCVEIDMSEMSIKKIEKGCVKLTLEGNSDDVNRIVLLVRSGELKELLGCPIQEAQALEIVGGEEIREAEDKWALISSIRADTPNSMRRDLAKKDLSDANLQSVYLVGANLSKADLSCVDLSGAQLSRANLCNADLTDADLTGANLNDAKLQGANLRDATLDKSDLRHVTIDKKTIVNDKWRQVIQILENPGKFKDCSGRDLSMAKLASIDWRKANLRGADLREVDFTGADLKRANFNSANLSNANLIDAELKGANFEAAEVKGAHFKDGRGLTDSEIKNLLSRGAIFNRGSGDPTRPTTWQPSSIRPTD